MHLTPRRGVFPPGGAFCTPLRALTLEFPPTDHLLLANRMRVESVFQASLENELQRELHDALGPGAGDIASAEVICLAADGLIVTGCPEGGGRVASGADALPLGVVEGVVGFPTELEGGVLTFEPRRLEVLEQRQVPVVAARARQRIITHISEHPRLTVGAQLGELDLADIRRVIPLHLGAVSGIVIDALLDRHGGK